MPEVRLAKCRAAYQPDPAGDPYFLTHAQEKALGLGRLNLPRLFMLYHDTGTSVTTVRVHEPQGVSLHEQAMTREPGLADRAQGRLEHD